MNREPLCPGMRIDNPGEPVQEYTSLGRWVPVCARDDVAMTGLTEAGGPCCLACAGTVTKVGVRS